MVGTPQQVCLGEPSSADTQIGGGSCARLRVRTCQIERDVLCCGTSVAIATAFMFNHQLFECFQSSAASGFARLPWESLKLFWLSQRFSVLW